MKERPILFSAPAARVLLEGSKTQKRRALRRRLALAASFERINAAQEGKSS